VISRRGMVHADGAVHELAAQVVGADVWPGPAARGPRPPPAPIRAGGAGGRPPGRKRPGWAASSRVSFEQAADRPIDAAGADQLLLQPGGFPHHQGEGGGAGAPP
jgi:hypothetical protein